MKKFLLGLLALSFSAFSAPPETEVDSKFVKSSVFERLYPSEGIVELDLSELEDVRLTDLQDEQCLSWSASNQKWVNRTISSSGGGIVGEYVKEIRAIVNGITVIRGDDSSYNVMVDESDLLRTLAQNATNGLYEIQVNSGTATLVRADAGSSGGVTTQEVTSLIQSNILSQCIAGNTDPFDVGKIPDEIARDSELPVKASSDEVVAGTDDEKFVTPLRLQEKVDAIPSGGSQTDTNDLPSTSEVNFLRGNSNTNFSVSITDDESRPNVISQASSSTPLIQRTIFSLSGSANILRNFTLGLNANIGALDKIEINGVEFDVPIKTSPVSTFQLNGVDIYEYTASGSLFVGNNVTGVYSFRLKKTDGSYYSDPNQNTESKIPIEDVATNLRPHLNIPEATESLTDDQTRALAEMSVAKSDIGVARSIGTVSNNEGNTNAKAVSVANSYGGVTPSTPNEMGWTFTKNADNTDASAPDRFRIVYLGYAGNNNNITLQTDLADSSGNRAFLTNIRLTKIRINGVLTQFPQTPNTHSLITLDGVRTVYTSTPSQNISNFNTLENVSISVEGYSVEGVVNVVTDSVTLSNKFDVSQAQGLPEGGLTTEEQTKLNNSLRDLDLGTDGVLKVFDNNSTTNTQSDIDEEFNLSTILERFFVTKEQNQNISRLSQADVDYLKNIQTYVQLQNSQTSRVEEDSVFGSNYFDYRSSSESYFSSGVSYDSSSGRLSGLNTSRQKIIAITKTGFGEHFGITDSSDRDTGIVRTNSSNQLQVNSAGTYTPTWVFATTGLSNDPLVIANGDTLIIETTPDHFTAGNILVEIDIVRANGTIIELSANSIPHNSYDWDILVPRHGTFKGADLNHYLSHSGRQALVSHLTDKWVFGKAQLVTSVLVGVNVDAELREENVRVSTGGSSNGGGGLTAVHSSSDFTGDGTADDPLTLSDDITRDSEVEDWAKTGTATQIKLDRIPDEIARDSEIPSAETGATIKTKLESLTGDDRLDASAVKNIPTGGGGGSGGFSIQTHQFNLTPDSSDNYTRN